MKNVLFIVYYFPPMGGSGVQRPLKFIKYLRQFDWNPFIVAPRPGAYHTFDYSLQDELDEMDVEVYRAEAATPFHMMGKSPQKIDFIPEKLAGYLRNISSFFWLPDNKTGWIEPALEKAEEVIRKYDIDIIYSTAPPYSNHLIATRLKKKYNIPVLVDFRDDWLESHFIHYPTRWHYQKMAKMEANCLKSVDGITVINEKLKESFDRRKPKKVPAYVLPQGYDPDDFNQDGGKRKKRDSSGVLKFLYSGIFYEKNQPDSFLKAVHLFIQHYPELQNKIELWFQGGLDNRHLKLVDNLGLRGIIKNFGYVDHSKAVKNLLDADILWFIIGQKKNHEYITTGKFFEYIAVRKPILGLVREGMITEYLKSYNSDYIAHPNNIEAIAEQIQIIYKDWDKQTFRKVNDSFVRKYDRREITSKLCDVFQDCLDRC